MNAFSGFVKGVGAGIAVGMVTSMVTHNMKRGRKTVKKNALRAVKSVGDFFSNVQYMIK